MTSKEKQKFLEEHLEMLTSAIESAAAESFYGHIPELSKQALEVLDRIETT